MIIRFQNKIKVQQKHQKTYLSKVLIILTEQLHIIPKQTLRIINDHTIEQEIKLVRILTLGSA
jgi:hypothetical protein